MPTKKENKCFTTENIMGIFFFFNIMLFSSVFQSCFIQLCIFCSKRLQKKIKNKIIKNEKKMENVWTESFLTRPFFFAHKKRTAVVLLLSLSLCFFTPLQTCKFKKKIPERELFPACIYLQMFGISNRNEQFMKVNNLQYSICLNLYGAQIAAIFCRLAFATSSN